MNAKEVDSSKKYVKKTQSNAHSSLRRIICLVCIKNGLQCPVLKKYIHLCEVQKCSRW